MKRINTLVIAVGGKGERISADLDKLGFKSTKVLLKVDGKPILGHLIDNALQENFQRIFLLVSHYENDFVKFIQENYRNNKKISLVCGGKKGVKLGVPYLLYSIRNKLRQPFVYTDGNILYTANLLRRMSSSKVISSYLVNLALSSTDHAPTHSQVTKYRGRVRYINPRPPVSRVNDKQSRHMKAYYSLGLMTLKPQIFRYVPKFIYEKDLDRVVKDIFESNKNLVNATIYSGPWLSVHTINDLDKFGIKW